MELFKLFMQDVLLTIYTSFGWSCLTAFLSLFFYLYAFHPQKGGKGMHNALKQAFITLKRDKTSRHFFFLSLYTCMVLFRTLFNRDLWLNPLSNLFDGWGIHNSDKALRAEAIENMVMLMPFVLASYLSFPGWFHKKGIIKGALLTAGSFSLFIETCQLLFRLGTFQFSDLFYNTTGGVLTGILISIIHCNKQKYI